MLVQNSIARYILSTLNSLSWVFREQRQLIQNKIRSETSPQVSLLVPEVGCNGRIGYTPRTVHLVGRHKTAELIFNDLNAELDGGIAYQFLAPFLGDRSLFVLDGPDHSVVKSDLYSFFASELMSSELRLDSLIMMAQRSLLSGCNELLPVIRETLAHHRMQSLFGDTEIVESRNIVLGAQRGVDLVSGAMLMFPNVFGKHSKRRVLLRRIRVLLRRFIRQSIENDSIVGGRFRSIQEQLGTGALIDNLLTILVAGFETSSAAATWALIDFANDIPLQQAIVDEILDAESKHLTLLSYLKSSDTLLHRACWNSLRAHPPIPFVLRKAKSTFNLEGALVNEGDYVLISIEAINASCRETESGGCQKKAEIIKTLTFGGGVKKCPGKLIAVLEMKAIIYGVLKNFTVQPVSPALTKIHRNRITAVPTCEGSLILTNRSQ